MTKFYAQVDWSDEEFESEEEARAWVKGLCDEQNARVEKGYKWTGWYVNCETCVRTDYDFDYDEEEDEPLETMSWQESYIDKRWEQETCDAMD